MLELDEALEAALTHYAPLATERVPLREAHGRRIASAFCAVHPEPPFDASAMDGYAVRSADLAEAREDHAVTLRVVGTSRAGLGYTGEVPPGACVRISTGAPMPRDADSVLVQEDATREGDSVHARFAPRVGHHVRATGAERAPGDVVVEAGRRIDPGTLSALAAQDVASLEVRARPRVHVLSTGDELRMPGTPARPFSIVASNALLLEAMIAAEGGVPSLSEIVPDDVAAIASELTAASERCDVVVSTGGASVGDHDGLRAAMTACGVRIALDRVRMKPGKPVLIGRFPNGVPMVALPGNPAAAFVGFSLFVAPGLRRMQGADLPFPHPWRLRTTTALSRSPGRPELARGRLLGDGSVELRSHQGSAAQRSLVDVDVLVYLEADRARVEVGETLVGYPLARRDEAASFRFRGA